MHPRSRHTAFPSSRAACSITLRTSGIVRDRRSRHAGRGAGVVAGVLALCAAAQAQSTERVSVATDGTQGNLFSHTPEGRGAISADGRFVVFESFASTLVAGDTNSVWDVFLRDRLIGTTERVSVAPGGAQVFFDSDSPAISADGRFIAFRSNAQNVAAGMPSGYSDVYVRDRQLGTSERVNLDSSGNPANSGGFFPVLSGDGRYVAFQSDASNLVAGDTNTRLDVFVRDRQTGTTTRVSVATGGAQGNDDSWGAAISADGRFVAFQSFATNLVAGDTNQGLDIFVRDRQTGTTERVNVATGGAQAILGSSNFPALSADGRYVTFESSSENLVANDTNLRMDVFVRDRVNATTTRVSVATGGAQGDSTSRYSSISADGRFVAFQSDSTNFAAGDTNLTTDVFVRDRLSGTTQRVSVTTGGAQASNTSEIPSISTDGRYVAFQSVAADLVPGDTNFSHDVFVRDGGVVPAAPFCTGDGSGAPCPCANNGTAGRGCASQVFPGGAVLSSSGNAGASASDTLVLTASGVPGPALFFQSSGLSASPITLGDGQLCAAIGIIRLGVVFPAGGTASYPGGTTPNAIHVAGSTSNGDVRHYQCWYRSVPGLCGTQNFNLTQGLTVTWGP